MGSSGSSIASFKWDMITIEQQSPRAEAQLTGHCDHEQEASQRKIFPFFGEMKLDFGFLL